MRPKRMVTARVNIFEMNKKKIQTNRLSNDPVLELLVSYELPLYGGRAFADHTPKYVNHKLSILLIFI